MQLLAGQPLLQLLRSLPLLRTAPVLHRWVAKHDYLLPHLISSLSLAALAGLQALGVNLLLLLQLQV